MAGIKAAIWAHGIIAAVQNPELLHRTIENIPPAAVERLGWGATFRGQEDSETWFHFPFCNPVILDGARLKLAKVFVFYKTEGWAKIASVHVYDGPRKVKVFDGLGLSGSHISGIDASNNWVVAPGIVISYGLGLSVKVEFGVVNNNVVPGILFSTVGADFVT